MKSLALCTYNGDKYLIEQINSILNQTMKLDEIIVTDDGSSDGTREILEQFSKDYPGLFSLNFSSDRVGTIQNFHRTLSRCNGDIIFLSDQDDVWVPDKVEKVVGELERKKSTLLVFSDGLLINNQGESIGSTLWDKWDFNPIMRNSWKNNINAFHALVNNNNRATGATIAIRRELLDSIDNFDTPLDFWHDTLLALHAAAQNGLYFIEEALIKYRIHDSQQVGVTMGSNFNEMQRAQAISEDVFQAKIKRQYPKLFNKWYCVYKSILNRTLLRY